jgi:hypothetical protein
MNAKSIIETRIHGGGLAVPADADAGGYPIGAASISGAVQHHAAPMALSARAGRVTGSGGSAPAMPRAAALAEIPAMTGEILALSNGVFVAFADLADMRAAHFV